MQKRRTTEVLARVLSPVSLEKSAATRGEVEPRRSAPSSGSSRSAFLTSHVSALATTCAWVGAPEPPPVRSRLWLAAAAAEQ